MKTSYDTGKSSKSQTLRANEVIPSWHPRSGNHHPEETTQSTSRQAHGRSHGANMMPCQAENLLPGWREAEMLDVCNGNFPQEHASEEISCKTSEKLPHQVSSKGRNKDGVLKRVSATQNPRDEPKDSSKAVFTFWANKVQEGSKTTTFQKPLQKLSMAAGSCSPVPHPKEGLSSLEDEKQAGNPQRKTRRDLSSAPVVFSHVDTHVLHVSQENMMWMVSWGCLRRSTHQSRSCTQEELCVLVMPICDRKCAVHGEVSVMLGSTHPTEFTYQLSRLQGPMDGEDISAAHGMMTVSENNMTTTVTPPAEGWFDLVIFACRADSQDPYNWLCSYEIQCLEPHNREKLPENPFHFWGLHQKVKDFGIKESSHTGKLLLVPQGTLLLTLQASRPLLGTSELVNKDLDDALSKKFLAAQAEGEKLSCHLLCPFQGYYQLSMLVKDFGGSRFRNATNILLHCLRPMEQNLLFPSGLSMHCSRGISSFSLSDPSHAGLIITAKLGKGSITFHTPTDIQLTASSRKDQVSSAKYPLQRYLLVTHLRTKVSVCVVLPEPGTYKVELFGRSKEQEAFVHICDYVVHCSLDPSWPPFPRVYSLWGRGSVLLEPRTGLLPEQSRAGSGSGSGCPEPAKLLSLGKRRQS